MAGVIYETKERPIMWFDDNGNGPHEHVCEVNSELNVVERWLWRQKLANDITPDDARAVEKLIEDLL